jgi:endonuclease/exonuclease/phosphatase (EEP) superfamily protein YafD
MAALVHPLAALAARWDWRADLIVHFQAPALAVTLAAAVALSRRHRRAAVALGVLAVYQVMPLARYWGGNPVPPDPRTGERLRILVANVLVENPDHEALVRLIRREDPDVVALVELSDDWLADLASVRRDYPFGVSAPDGARGLALWFRRPPLSADGPERPSPDGWPLLHAVVELGGRPRHLWLVHPSSPLRRWDKYRGFPELDALARRIGRAGGSQVVVGDLNTTAASPHFADFLVLTGLRDSRLGFGPQGSWPSWSPYRIAIDHAFLSADLAAAGRRLGPDIGSDHFPLILEVAPAAASAAAKSATQASQPSP